ncbi:MAG TPA: hypothetical protein VNC84_05965 [Gammaproteobacteria bacterium]|jgi:Tfp pilus assembly protein PilX|nr:hypothetical protein [Gammaproteobacteria bacterium]
MRRKQQGYFLIVAVILILVIGTMGAVIAYLLATRSLLSAAQQKGLTAFYIAESALSTGGRLLTMPALTGTPSRSSCAAITGTAAITNASLNGGTFTVTTTNSSPIYAINSLAAGVPASATTIPLTSAAGFAPYGKVMVDKETINYAAISGNSLIGVTRGASGSIASAHASGASVGQYTCLLDAQAGIPSISAPSYQREIRGSVQLQNGWAVANNSGSSFNLTQWNRGTEKSWTAATVSSSTTAGILHSVSMLSYGDGWAVTDQKNSLLIFLHWNGSSWTVNTIPSICNNQDLYGVSAVSSIESWAVGARYKPGAGCTGTLFRHNIVKWNGTTWSVLAPASIPADNANNQNLNAVNVIDTTGSGTGNIGFAVGDNGEVLQYSGGVWTKLTAISGNNLYGVSTVSTSEAWAVGQGGVIFRWNGTAWSTFSSPVTTDLNAIVMQDTNGDGLADAGFAVGNSQRILTYNGSSWSFVDLGGTNLFGVDMYNAQDAWAVGASGLILHWDGSSWTSVSSGVSPQLNAISLVPLKKQALSSWNQVFN